MAVRKGRRRSLGAPFQPRKERTGFCQERRDAGPHLQRHEFRIAAIPSARPPFYHGLGRHPGPLASALGILREERVKETDVLDAQTRRSPPPQLVPDSAEQKRGAAMSVGLGGRPRHLRTPAQALAFEKKKSPISANFPSPGRLALAEVPPFPQSPWRATKMQTCRVYCFFVSRSPNRQRSAPRRRVHRASMSMMRRGMRRHGRAHAQASAPCQVKAFAFCSRRGHCMLFHLSPNFWDTLACRSPEQGVPDDQCLVSGTYARVSQLETTAREGKHVPACLKGVSRGTATTLLHVHRFCMSDACLFLHTSLRRRQVICIFPPKIVAQGRKSEPRRLASLFLSTRSADASQYGTARPGPTALAWSDTRWSYSYR